MKEIAIKVEDINKIYKLYDKPLDRLKESLSITKKLYSRAHYALRNISFEILKGETVGIIGINGSGKSTLLKILTGVLTQTSGNYMVNGKISALLELGAGFNAEYTGIENIYLNGTMMGFSKEDIDDRLENILEFADIGEFIYQPVKTYSSGMFARLAFAVAINVDPDILIVDEALSVGDIFFQSKCYSKFAEFKKRGKTILFVSHDLSSIIKYCGKTIVMNKGEVVSIGSSSDMVDIYKKILVNQYDEGKLNKKENKISEDVDSIIWKSELDLNNKCIEYGDERAKIIDFAIIDSDGKITNNIIKGTNFTIKMKIKFYETINMPIYAFTIKDIKGTEITGTNTVLENIDTEIRNCGDIIKVSFLQNMNLQGTSYFLSLGCTGYEKNNLTVYNRLYDVCAINVISEKNSVGVYDMNSTIEIQNA